MELFGYTKVVDPEGVKLMYKDEAARGTRMLFEEGFSPCDTNGDVSIRDPETGYVYISGSPKMRPNMYRNLGEFRAVDMAVIDLDCNYIVPWADATIEAPMHTAILKMRPEINAVVHTHATWSSAWAVSGKNIPLILPEQMGHLGGEIECIEYSKAGSPELCENICAALGKTKFAAIMRNHGAVAIGRDLEEAYANARFLEQIARKAFLASKLGEMRILSPEECFEPGVDLGLAY